MLCEVDRFPGWLGGGEVVVGGDSDANVARYLADLSSVLEVGGMQLDLLFEGVFEIAKVK